MEAEGPFKSFVMLAQVENSSYKKKKSPLFAKPCVEIMNH